MCLTPFHDRRLNNLGQSYQPVTEYRDYFAAADSIRTLFF